MFLLIQATTKAAKTARAKSGRSAKEVNFRRKDRMTIIRAKIPVAKIRTGRAIRGTGTNPAPPPVNPLRVRGTGTIPAPPLISPRLVRGSSSRSSAVRGSRASGTVGTPTAVRDLTHSLKAAAVRDGTLISVSKEKRVEGNETKSEPTKAFSFFGDSIEVIKSVKKRNEEEVSRE